MFIRKPIKWAQITMEKAFSLFYVPRNSLVCYTIWTEIICVLLNEYVAFETSNGNICVNVSNVFKINVNKRSSVFV